MNKTVNKTKIQTRNSVKRRGKRTASLQEVQSNRRLLMICFALVFAAIGTILLTFSSAATSQTSFSGTLSKKQPVRTHSIATTVSGTINAQLSATKSATPLTLRLLQDKTVVAQATGAPAVLSAPVGSGTFTFEVSGTVSSPTSYVLTLSYPVPDPTPVADATPPSAPTALTATAGGTNQIALAWQSSTDAVGVANYDVLRGGSVIATTTTTTYSDVTVAPSTTYSYTVRARDAAGNVGPLSNVASATTVTPSDTTPPTVSISAPTQGQTTSGSVTATGMAADNASVAKLEVQIDNTGYVPATYSASAASWSYGLNTSLYADGTHQLTARATDGSGNASTATTSFAIQNTAASSSTAPSTQGTWTSPEGVVISVATTQINPANGQAYTIKYVYDMLKQESAASSDFTTIAPHLAVKVQDTTSSQTSSSAGTTNGVYTSFHATMYLKAGSSSTYGSRPNQITAHEYGHAWTMYYTYLQHSGSFADYLNTRWSGANGIPLIGQDSRLNSTYNWSTNEMIADDYRLLFGTSTAQNQAGYINSDIVDSRNQPGLANWFLTNWK